MKKYSMRAFVGLVCLFGGFLVPSSAYGFLNVGEVSEKDLENDLVAELTSTFRQGAENRPRDLEAILRPMFTSLPKMPNGQIEHTVVRFVLHRWFMQQHGWFIKGLEPDGDKWNASAPTGGLKEWVPTYLQRFLEKLLGEDGANLHQLAVLAATLEDLVHKESLARLHQVYRVLDFPETGRLSTFQSQEVFSAYLMVFLMEGNVTFDNRSNAELKMRRFARKYDGWKEAEQWLRDEVQAAVPDSKQANFQDATHVVEQVGEQYGTFNDRECRDLTDTLASIEAKPGRVLLSDFYNMSFHTHWRFHEKVDYLRTLGALDESEPGRLKVILPNYVASRPNCLEASGFYAVCCRNECEDFIGYLEREIAAPEAEPSRIVHAVKAFSSPKFAQVSEISNSLLQRLDEIAAGNRERVPLHGRLFSQWMHHLFPRQCPYPHITGTTSPLTADEWLQKTGHEDTKASEEEMLCYVNSNGKADCGDTKPEAIPDQDAEAQNQLEVQELPWSQTEELLTIHAQDNAEKTLHSIAAVNIYLRTSGLACLALGLALVAKTAVASTQFVGWQGISSDRMSLMKSAGQELGKQWWITLMFFFFPVVIVSVDYLLEGFEGVANEALACAALWGLLASVAHQFATKFGIQPAKNALAEMTAHAEADQCFV